MPNGSGDHIRGGSRLPKVTRRLNPGITAKYLSFKSTRLTGTLACCSHTAWFSMTSMMSLAQVAKRGATSGLRQQVVSRGEWISKDSCLISDTS